jgi:hypothetical protein
MFQQIADLKNMIIFPVDLTGRVEVFMVLFCISTILTLPFASPLLSTRLRSRLGLRQVVLILMILFVVAPTVLAMLAEKNLLPPYTKFTIKSQRYYHKLADACDKVLVEHPLGTNQVLRVSVMDPTLPKIITDLKPVEIRVEPQSLWMMVFSKTRAGYAVGWEPQQGNTNVWELYAGAGENFFTTVYTAKHNPLSNSTSAPMSK